MRDGMYCKPHADALEALLGTRASGLQDPRQGNGHNISWVAILFTFSAS
jgi:hypothetical protein